MNTKDLNTLKKLLENHPVEVVEAVLYQALPLKIDSHHTYQRGCDEDPRSVLELQVAGNNDVYLSLIRGGDELGVQFCPQGRGTSPKVRNALVILAHAIKIENIDRPQK